MRKNSQRRWWQSQIGQSLRKLRLCCGNETSRQSDSFPFRIEDQEPAPAVSEIFHRFVVGPQVFLWTGFLKTLLQSTTLPIHHVRTRSNPGRKLRGCHEKLLEPPSMDTSKRTRLLLKRRYPRRSPLAVRTGQNRVGVLPRGTGGGSSGAGNRTRNPTASRVRSSIAVDVIVRSSPGDAGLRRTQRFDPCRRRML